MPSTRLFSIPTGQPFLPALARGILHFTGPGPDLSNALILLPSRRAVRALREAFLAEADGRPLLLPRMMPVGELDNDEDILLRSGAALDLPEPISPLQRQMLLAKQLEYFQLDGRRLPPDQLVDLAASLAQLLDQMQRADVSGADLQKALPEDMARHWEAVYHCLQIIVAHWPAILAEAGLIDPVARQQKLLHQLFDDCAETPPKGQVFLAGTTGSVPTTRRLMSLMMDWPKSAIILPALSAGLSASDIEAIRSDRSHPQFPLVDTLDTLACAPADVALWPGCIAEKTASKLPLEALLDEVFCPAELTARWRQLARTRPEINAASVAHMRQINARSGEEEAQIIASMMREVLEEPGRTALVITPDRTLANQITHILRGWQLEVEDSAGAPLTKSAPARFCQALLEGAISNWSPRALLNLMNHPLACGGLERRYFSGYVRQIEQVALRGHLPDPSLEGIRSRLSAHPALLSFLDQHVIAHLEPLAAFAKMLNPSLGQLSEALGQTAEAMAATPEDPNGVDRLYGMRGGRELLSLLSELAALDLRATPSLQMDMLPSLFFALCQQKIIRPPVSHPRLSVLSPIEARLLSADRVILAGLNEGSWPQQAQADPWMGNAMRRQLGLPDRTSRLGLSAHDFYSHLGHDEVILTRASRQNNSLTSPSRWLMRLDAVLAATKLDSHLKTSPPDWLVAVLNDQQKRSAMALKPPAPKPPLNARPRFLSATDFDKWIDDPYSLYAKRVLKLRALQQVDAPPGPLLRGDLFHKVLEDFMIALPDGPLDQEASDLFDEIADRHFSQWSHYPQISLFWRPRLQRVKDWFLAEETDRRASKSISYIEQTGYLSFDMPGGEVRLQARADRIDKTADGRFEIIDYKTGQAPNSAKVVTGRRTQLLVEAAILHAGGYDMSASHTDTKPAIEAVSYWQLSGRRDRPVIQTRISSEKIDPAKTLDQITDLIRLYDDADMAYEVEPHPAARPDFSETRHLSRVREWRIGEVDDD
ncbi:MAG: double-strand break repair protein AddB [Candidatus Puniceispirillaceae bacterium]